VKKAPKKTRDHHTDAAATREIMGMNHPLMTPQLAQAILPEGPRVPVPLLHRVCSLLCNPVAYRETSAGDLLTLADQISTLMDRQLRAAQETQCAPSGPTDEQLAGAIAGLDELRASLQSLRQRGQ